MTFCAEQRGGALQELSDLLQRSLFSASDAALGVVAAGQAGDLIANDSSVVSLSAAVELRSCSLLQRATSTL